MKRILLLGWCALTCAAQELRVYAIDVEGGKATLYVSPSGQSMLVDAGYAGFANRDADRIVAAAKAAGVTQIDYLVITHYHGDHMGGVPQLAAKMPIRNFVDHGQTFEGRPAGVYADYLAVRAKGNHIEVKAGDRIPIEGIDVEVVTASGKAITKPLPGAGQPNPLCAELPADRVGQRGERPLHRNDDHVRQVPPGGPGRPSLESGVRSGMPEQSVGHGGRVHDDAPREEDVGRAGDRAGPASEGGDHEQRRRTTARAKRRGRPFTNRRARPTSGNCTTPRATTRSTTLPPTFIANQGANCKGFGIKLTARADGHFTIQNERTQTEKRTS